MMLYRVDDYPYERIPAPLLAWYDQEKRDLAWRKNSDPYRVWVSEIMLQQTRVEAVKEYYDRFMRALPTVEALASVDEEKLLKLWEGLGYYSRARNLQKAAKLVVASGGFPCEPKELEKLPGIGGYTAGAIASIAFGKRTPAVDGNVFRVLSRLTENPTVISEPKYRAYLEEKLGEIYPEEGKRCSDFTQSLMELGALVCKPTSPDCEVCPLSSVCRVRVSGRQGEFPVLPEKKAKREEKLFVFLLVKNGGVYVEKRTSGLLKGMYGFPTAQKEGRSAEEILKEWGVSAFTKKKEGRFTHIFTHVKWEMECLVFEVSDAPFLWVSGEALEREVSLPTAFKQCVRMLP
ncbi:MAG: A/G-specific adenine glycosylase [Clostridia bacterium]|nr:A/G-specific adenine glycosylase [Clostridia bacterium]